MSSTRRIRSSAPSIALTSPASGQQEPERYPRRSGAPFQLSTIAVQETSGQPRAFVPEAGIERSGRLRGGESAFELDLETARLRRAAEPQSSGALKDARA